jgi:hypothetical protein
MIAELQGTTVTVVDPETGEVVATAQVASDTQLRETWERATKQEKVGKAVKECINALVQDLVDQNGGKEFVFPDGASFRRVDSQSFEYQPEAVISEVGDVDIATTVLKVDTRKLKTVAAQWVEDGIAPAGLMKRLQQGAIPKAKSYVKLEKPRKDQKGD